MRTGEDQHLSAPISFQPLFETDQTLKANWADIGSDFEGDIVRVTVDFAVQFVLSLVRREEAASPSLASRRGAQEEQEVGCKKWVERIIENAGKAGIDANGFTWAAIRRARGRFNREALRPSRSTLCAIVRVPGISDELWS